jgi:hypothetical protein
LDCSAVSVIGVSVAMAFLWYFVGSHQEILT